MFTLYNIWVKINTTFAFIARNLSITFGHFVIPQLDTLALLTIKIEPFLFGNAQLLLFVFQAEGATWCSIKTEITLIVHLIAKARLYVFDAFVLLSIVALSVLFTTHISLVLAEVALVI